MFFEHMLGEIERRVSVVRTMFAEEHVCEQMLEKSRTKWKMYDDRRERARKIRQT